MMAGGAAGAIFGGGARGATATGEALLGRPQARKAGAGTPRARSAPVRLTGEELAPFDVPIGDLRAAALNWYNENLVDTGLTVTNEHDGRAIRFEPAGAQKTERVGEGLLRAVPAIPEMLRTGRPLGSQPDRKGREVIRAWHRYAAAAEVGGRRHDAVLVVRERPDGTFHYSLQHYSDSAGAGSSTSQTGVNPLSRPGIRAPLEGGPGADETID